MSRVQLTIERFKYSSLVKSVPSKEVVHHVNYSVRYLFVGVLTTDVA